MAARAAAAASTAGGRPRPLPRLAAPAALTPRAIKLDIEGAEPEALVGLGERLEDPALLAVLVEMSRPDAVAAALRRGGFRPAAYDAFTRRLSWLDGPDPDADNTLFCRPDPAVERRLREAPPMEIASVRF